MKSLAYPESVRNSTWPASAPPYTITAPTGASLGSVTGNFRNPNLLHSSSPACFAQEELGRFETTPASSSASFTKCQHRQVGFEQARLLAISAAWIMRRSYLTRRAWCPKRENECDGLLQRTPSSFVASAACIIGGATKAIKRHREKMQAMRFMLWCSR